MAVRLGFNFGSLLERSSSFFWHRRIASDVCKYQQHIKVQAARPDFVAGIACVSACIGGYAGIQLWNHKISKQYAMLKDIQLADSKEHKPEMWPWFKSALVRMQVHEPEKMIACDGDKGTTRPMFFQLGDNGIIWQSLA